MEVPVRRTPGTQVATQTRGYADAALVDLGPIAQGLGKIAEASKAKQLQAAEEARKLQLAQEKFDLNKRLLEERQRMTEDYQARKLDPARSIDTFAEDLDLDYEAAHNAILEEYWNQGYDEELLADMASQLGGVRTTFFTNGLEYQATSLASRAMTDLDKMNVMASQSVATNPDSFAEMDQFIQENVDLNPYLTPQQKEAAKANGRATLIGSGGKALAKLQPDLVFELLDPTGEWRAAEQVTPAAVGTSVTAKAGSWQSVATTVANELGLDAGEVAAVMSFETGGTMNPNIQGGDGGRYLGLIQFGPEEQRKYGIKVGSTPEQWSQAILGFMKDRGFKPGMGIEDFYSTILAGSPGRYNATDSNGTNVTNAIPRILKDHGPKAKAWLESALETVDPGASTANQSPALDMAETAPTTPQSGPFAPNMGQTGNALLDAMTGEQRIQVLGWAMESVKQQQVAEKSAMDVVINNIKAEALSNGEVATAIPSEAEVLRVYGPVAGPQVWAEVQQTLQVGKSIQTFRTMDGASIQAKLNGLKPTPGSDTYATELQIYEAAQKAASQILQEREDDPAAYVMKHFPSVAAAAEKGEGAYYAALDRAFEQLGIDPQQVSPMPKASADKIAKDWGLMDPSAKVQFFMDNFKTMGEDRFQKFVRDMRGTPAEKEARIFALLGPTTGRTTITRVLEGMEVIRKDSARRPDFNKLRTNFREQAFSALGNLDADTSGAIQDAAAALYVMNGGDPANIDAEIYEESLQVAMGGRQIADMTNKTWGWNEIVKDQTILPPNVTKKQFENWIESRKPGDLTALSVRGLPPLYGDGKTKVALQDIIDYGVFVMLAPDLYGIKMATDGGKLVDETGQAFVVRIGKGTIK